MFRRLFLTYLAILVAALAVFGAFAARSTRLRALDATAARLDAETELLKPVVRANAPRDLQPVLKELGRSTESRLTVIDGSGAVLADSHAPPAPMDNPNGRPEVQQARATGRGRTVEADTMYSAAAVDARDGVVVRSALPLTQVGRELAGVYASLFAAFVVALLLGAAGTGALARWITRPLGGIRDAAQSIAAGDLTVRVDEAAPGEMGGVAVALNRMTKELATRVASIRAESAKLDALVSSMEEAVVALDTEGRIEHHNAAARRLLGIDVDPRGLKLWEVVRLPDLQEKVTRVLRDGASVRMPLEIGARTVVASVSPISGGRGAVLVAHDATEERRYDTMRKEFVANVSHELRTPLTLIVGFVETLKDGALKDEARAMEFLETIDRHSRRLAAIVADLLELSRLESSGPIARPRVVDVAALLAGVREQFQPLAEKKRITLDIKAAPDALELEADPDLVERALDNLVGNAIKYTPDGGTIRLSAEAGDGEIVFTVADTGVGIPEKDLARIFERFYRVDKSRSRELGGTGLGLAIVKHIAQLHSGRVSVTSSPGTGSTFTLRLPRRFAAA